MGKLFDLKLPPGVRKGGTDEKSAGFYMDGNLVRWDPDLKPFGGWRLRSEDTVTGMARSIVAWKDNGDIAWVGVGTHSNLYVYDLLTDLYDITPVGFSEGFPDTQVNTGYGGGLYGAGTYGTPRPLTNTPVDATIFTLGVAGQHLVACSTFDGVIWVWELDENSPAEALANAPSARGVAVVKQFVFALGAGGDPKALAWSDRGDPTLWTPDADNQAGDFDIETDGKLMCMAALGDYALILADDSATLASYVGPQTVWEFRKLGEGCGAISQGCVASLGERAVWMSQAGFWMVESGFLVPLKCDFEDDLFSDLNLAQGAKVTCIVDSLNGVIRWHYPSGGSTENDRYVEWSFIDGWWGRGELARTAGCDRGALPYPLMMTPAGELMEHEVGWDYGGASPWAETGPIKIGAGDNILLVDGFIPDERTLGDINVTFYVKDRPTSAEATYGPYTVSERTDLRFGGRIVRARYTFIDPINARVGEPALSVIQGGRR